MRPRKRVLSYTNNSFVSASGMAESGGDSVRQAAELRRNVHRILGIVHVGSNLK
jgi:hypothetical protein